MAFCITFGTHDFTGQLKGYEGVTAQCHNCGNWSAHCITRWPFFTVCFLPLIPLSTHKYKEVACPICNFMQDLSNRPDVQSQHPGAGNMLAGGPGAGGGGHGAPPPGYPPGPGQGGAPPPPLQQGGGGGMQYK